eukprot:NODE_224_length_12322_cov_0.795549.p7 type:complete len:204 gc:universal NODE_224_length_12322_cov_0.795549:1522-2133(+)
MVFPIHSGLGDQGSSWNDLKSFFKGWKCIFPNAPVQPVAINGNLPCPSWYNIYSLTDHSNQDQVGLLQTRQFIHDLIKKEMNDGVHPKNIIIGGFSQGAVCSLLTGLTLEVELGGIIALSGYLPIKDHVKQSKIQHIPIFMAHGTEDQVIPYKFSLQTRHALDDLDIKYTFKSYEFGHTADAKELQDMQNWVTELYRDNKSEL